MTGRCELYEYHVPPSPFIAWRSWGEAQVLLAAALTVDRVRCYRKGRAIRINIPVDLRQNFDLPQQKIFGLAHISYVPKGENSPQDIARSLRTTQSYHIRGLKLRLNIWCHSKKSLLRAAPFIYKKIAILEFASLDGDAVRQRGRFQNSAVSNRCD